MDRYIDEWSRLGLEFEGILTGFLGSPEQIDIVKRFIERFERPSTVTVIDPVMGDDGALYPTYPERLAQLMKTLVPHADILTPNLTEACLLTDTVFDPEMDEDGVFELCERISELGPKNVIISGLERGDDLENFIYRKGMAPQVVREHKVGGCRAGTGDVFSSIIAADAVNGVDLYESVKKASAFIAKALRRTVELGIPRPDGICFEEFLGQL